jgi:hypothetical protein
VWSVAARWPRGSRRCEQLGGEHGAVRGLRSQQVTSSPSQAAIVACGSIIAWL